MELIQTFRNKFIGVDTSIFIYFIEENPEYFSHVKELFQENKDGNIQIVTSSITLIELLVQPFRQSRHELVKQYKDILQGSANIDLVDLNPDISEIAARIRAENGLRTPDAIQVATAVYKKAEFFLTNDKRIKTIEDISISVLHDFL